MLKTMNLVLEDTLSFLFYLNDVEDGGETIFTGMEVSNQKLGRLISFSSPYGRILIRVVFPLAMKNIL
jgi:hypothetical protein